MANWSDPELGIFRFDGYCWTRAVTLPSFKEFKYRYRRRRVGRSNIPLRFYVESAEQRPTKRAVAIAKRVIRNEKAIASKMLKALFADIHGTGRSSGTWWHGKTDKIYETLSWETGSLRNLRIDTPESITKLLGNPAISIQERGHGYERPRAAICFDSLFEPEHGVAFLTYGTRILGMGYETDVEPFQQTKTG